MESESDVTEKMTSESDETGKMESESDVTEKMTSESDASGKMESESDVAEKMTSESDESGKEESESDASEEMESEPDTEKESEETLPDFYEYWQDGPMRRLGMSGMRRAGNPTVKRDDHSICISPIMGGSRRTPIRERLDVPYLKWHSTAWLFGRLEEGLRSRCHQPRAVAHDREEAEKIDGYEGLLPYKMVEDARRFPAGTAG